MDYRNTVIHGDCLNVLRKMLSNSIDCLITSPPYYGLRQYGDYVGEYNGWKGQLGLEPTVGMYIEHLMLIFDEVKRVLKPYGTCWVNLGDTYAGSGKGIGSVDPKWSNATESRNAESLRATNDKKFKDKCLMQIPARFSIAMTDRGWIMRNEIIWWKRNCMPSSATDRFTVDFEKVFMFVKQGRYFFEQQFEETKQSTIERLSRAISNTHRFVNGAEGQTPHGILRPRPNAKEYGGRFTGDVDGEIFNSPRARNQRKHKGGGTTGRENNCSVSTYTYDGGDYLVTPPNPQGSNKRTVWDVPTSGYRDTHFAVYPEKLVEPMIKAGCPDAVCTKCGEPRRKIIIKNFVAQEDVSKEKNVRKLGKGLDASNQWSEYPRGTNEIVYSGYTNCGCKAGYKPGIVLDIFAGSGTTGAAAKRLGRDYLLIESLKEYIPKIHRRIDEVRK